MSQLRNFDLAFKDRQDLVLDDVPLEFEGSPQMMINYEFEQEEISFSVNKKVSIFAAVPEGKPNPLDGDFEVPS